MKGIIILINLFKLRIRKFSVHNARWSNEDHDEPTRSGSAMMLVPALPPATSSLLGSSVPRVILYLVSWPSNTRKIE